MFDMLIYYFKHHEDGLNAEGLFRKSVSIVDEEQALEKLHKGNYNFLEKVQNPHLPASTFPSLFRPHETILSQIEYPDHSL